VRSDESAAPLLCPILPLLFICCALAPPSRPVGVVVTVLFGTGRAGFGGLADRFEFDAAAELVLTNFSGLWERDFFTLEVPPAFRELPIDCSAVFDRSIALAGLVSLPLSRLLVEVAALLADGDFAVLPADRFALEISLSDCIRVCEGLIEESRSYAAMSDSATGTCVYLPAGICLPFTPLFPPPELVRIIGLSSIA